MADKDFAGGSQVWRSMYAQRWNITCSFQHALKSAVFLLKQWGFLPWFEYYLPYHLEATLFVGRLELSWVVGV